MPKVSRKPVSDKERQGEAERADDPGAPRMPWPGLRNWNMAETATSEPRTKFGAVVVAVARMFVPNCSEAMVTKMAQ